MSIKYCCVIKAPSEETLDKFLEILDKEGIWAQSRKDPGNISYEYYRRISDPSEMILIEEWDSAELEAEHCTYWNVQRLRQARAELGISSTKWNLMMTPFEG